MRTTLSFRPFIRDGFPFNFYKIVTGSKQSVKAKEESFWGKVKNGAGILPAPLWKPTKILVKKEKEQKFFC